MRWAMLLGISLILGLVILSLIVYLPGLNGSTSEQESEFTKKILSSKPTLSGEITTNPDFMYGNTNWFTDNGNPVLERPEIDWESDGWYDNRTVDGRSDIIVIHPLDPRSGRFVQRDISLPNGSYELVVGIADIAGKISYAEPTDCNDVGFLIKIIESGSTNIISDEIINSEDGWVDLSFDITEFAEKAVTIVVESYAGGPCGDWGGEWAAVDYIDIV